MERSLCSNQIKLNFLKNLPSKKYFYKDSALSIKIVFHF